MLCFCKQPIIAFRHGNGECRQERGIKVEDSSRGEVNK